MPIHDWRRVEAGIFHDFHLTWIGQIKRVLNQELLPSDYYALAEQFAGGIGPDVLTLHHSMDDPSTPPPSSGGVALATNPPKVKFHMRADADWWYATRAKTVVIRHVSNHKIIAMVEIVSPGNKDSRHGFRTFVEKAVQVLRAGIHLVVIDLLPPGPRDPQGLHHAIWDEFMEKEFTMPADQPLLLASYVGEPVPEAFIEPTCVGATLADMPLFLLPEEYILLPLEKTYQTAWEAVPKFWQEVLEGRRQA